MWPFKRPDWRYSKANTEEYNEFELGDHKTPSRPVPSKRSCSSIISVVVIAVVCLVTGFGSGIFAQNRGLPVNFLHMHSAASTSCRNPETRREWRSLSMAEKHHYIDSVQCLRHLPSKLKSNLSMYDDFPMVHDTIGSYAHEAAPFLAWHRYFIHHYETTLREECGYQGTLTYWDWSLDWENPTEAPVFDPHHGFGGDSQPHSHPRREITVGDDRCVVDGPFAGLEVHWFGENENKHCLSRGFLDGDPFDAIAHNIRPEAIEDLIRLPSYQDFFLGLEDGPHNVIPHGIGGDFFFTVAPYDPLFFLHHTNLDRLWWRWQNYHPSRQMAYEGPKRHQSNESASLDDHLIMGGLAPEIKVKEVMSTESGLLCYRY